MSIFNNTRRNRNLQPRNVLTNSPVTNQRCEYENAFIQDHFSQNKTYFKSLLGSRLNGRNALVDSDIPLLKEAYDKAHEKAQFEIDLHWKRTTHIWTLILALIVATGAVLSLYLTADSTKKELFIFIILLFSIVGIIVSKTSISMLKVSHLWCRNWELHIVMLEPIFSGSLYRTHLGIGNSRFSLSKLNSIFIWIAYAFWILLFETSLLLLSYNLITFLIIGSVVYFIIVFSGFLIGLSITSKDKMNLEYELTQYGIKPVVNVPYTTKIVKNVKLIGKQLFYFTVIMTVFLVAYYFTLPLVSDLSLEQFDIKYLMHTSIKSLLPLLY